MEFKKQLVVPDRNYIISEDFYKEKNILLKTGLSIKDCRKIIKEANANIANIIAEEQDGFKLPFGLGYIVVTKYKTNRNMINWPASNKLGKHVYHTNLHTFGYNIRIKWFTIAKPASLSFDDVFKFKACRILSRKISSLFSNGKDYSEWSRSEFWEMGKLENYYNKKAIKNNIE